jgi:hypothetical protein
MWLQGDEAGTDGIAPRRRFQIYGLLGHRALCWQLTKESWRPWKDGGLAEGQKQIVRENSSIFSSSVTYFCVMRDGPVVVESESKFFLCAQKWPAQT